MEVFIVNGKRTPHGKLLGQMREFRAPELGAAAIEGLLGETGIEREDLGWCVMGNATSAGLGQVPARQASRNAGIPDEVPATTVNEASGSGLRAIITAADRISSGRIDTAVAGGMESMSNAPFLVPEMREGRRWGDTEMIDSMVRDSLWDMFYDAHMGELTEEFVERFDISREAQDIYSLKSHERAVEAREGGDFEEEIVPVGSGEKIDEDEGPRPDTSMEKLSGLDPAFDEEGTITAGNASDLSDGAASLLLASGDIVGERGLETGARIVDYEVSYTDPKWFPLAIEDAVEEILDRNGLDAGDAGLFEINEAFAAHMVHFREELGVPAGKLNVRGGAIALGHPIGASGGILTTTLLHTMEKENVDYGVVGMCVGGGGGICMLLERQ